MTRSLLLKNAALMAPADGFEGQVRDVLIADGLIAEIGPDLKTPARADVLDLTGLTAAPGFIDIHTHVDPDGPLNIGLFPDMAGIFSGNSTIIDAGSTGAGNFEAFRDKYIQNSRTRVYALLNLARNGIDSWSELAEEGNLAPEALKAVARANPGLAVGVKVRSDAEAVGGMGLTPFRMGRQVARELGLPLVVHIGEAPPTMAETLDLAGPGDLLTHCYTAYAPNGIYNSLVGEDGRVLDAVWRAKERGALFDVGHGGLAG